MNKNVWILNHYAGDTFFDRGGRHYSFAKYLKQNGYNPVVFCCNVKHNPGTEDWTDNNGLWCIREQKDISVPYVFIKSSHYDSNGVKRLRNMLGFAFNLYRTAKAYSNCYTKPDVIIASSVHPFTLVAGIKMAKRFHVRCMCEIRDLWPESIVAYGLASRNNIIVIALRRMEKWIYKKADSLIFTMEGAYDYIKEQGWEKVIPGEKVFFINNGVDLEVFERDKELFSIKDEDLENDKLFKVVYTGSIRKVNNVGKILDIAKKIKNPEVRFLIWGSGDETDILKDRIKEEGISNVIFKGRVEKQYVPFITSHADLNFAHNNESPLFRYGISFNKLFEYFAAGKPVICDFKAAYNPVENESAGFIVESGDPEAIAEMIDKLSMIDKSQFERMSQNAHLAAKKYDFTTLTNKLISIIER